MAKNQVSEEELTKGLKGIGNFGGLAPKVQRDNPFRDSRSDKPEPAKTIEVRLPDAEPLVAKAAKPEPKPLRTLPSASNTPRRGRAESLRSEEGGARKADIFTERVTLQISPEMRDDIDALARDLQRAKTTREERITANTVMRVALQLLMTSYQFERGDVANNEGELFDLVVRRFRMK
jgi:hypothetical protein